MKHHFDRTLLPLLAAALLLLPGSLSAQAAIGIGGGITSATFEGDDANEDLGSTTGFMVGAHLAFPLGEIISVVPGVYYVQKGAELETSAGDAKTKLGYIEVPLLLSVSVVGADRPFGLNLFAGPEVAFKISCSDEFDGDSEDCGDEDGFKGTDFGLIAGAGVTFGRFFVNGGLDLGLTSIVDDEGLDDELFDSDVKNSVYFLQAGIVIPMGG